MEKKQGKNRGVTLFENGRSKEQEDEHTNDETR
jgi:hypothetical protein